MAIVPNNTTLEEYYKQYGAPTPINDSRPQPQVQDVSSDINFDFGQAITHKIPYEAVPFNVESNKENQSKDSVAFFRIDSDKETQKKDVPQFPIPTDKIVQAQENPLFFRPTTDKNSVIGTVTSILTGRHTEGRDVSNSSPTSGRHINVQSELNLNEIGASVNYIANINATGFDTFMFGTQFKLESSQLGGNERTVNHFSDNNALGFTRRMIDTLFDPESSVFGGNNVSVDYIANINAEGFTRNVRHLETMFKVDSSQFGPNNFSTDYFADSNAIGFTRNVRHLETLYNVDSSQFGPNNFTVNYIADINATGFTRNVRHLETLFNVDSSQFGPNNLSVNYFANINASGFTRNVRHLATLFNVDSSQFGPNNKSVNYFADTNATGFTRNAVPLETLYKTDSTTFGGNDGSIDYIANIHAGGFNRFFSNTQYKTDTSAFTFVGSAPTVNNFNDDFSTGFISEMNDTNQTGKLSTFSFDGIPTVNYFSDENSTGFITNMGYGETNFKHESSQFTFSGTKQNSPEVNYIFNTFAEGFGKFFNTTAITKPVGEFNFETPPEEGGFVKNEDVGGQTRQEVSTNLGTLNVVNHFGNSVGTGGFIKNFVDPTDTLFPGASGESFDYPSLPVGGKRLVELYLTNSRFDFFGTATIPNQLGNGSPRFKSAEFNEKNKYEDVATNKMPLETYAITRRSPSPLDEQYDKFNARKDGHQQDYVHQPLILRGFQRDGEVENQRWGGFTDVEGLVDISPFGVLDVKANDLLRITKYQGSAKGLINIVKQQGLQRMNPAVETTEGSLDTVLGRPSWIYNPLSEQLGGNRHGATLFGFGLGDGRYEDTILPKNEVTNASKSTTGAFDGPVLTQNRLVTLYDELFEQPQYKIIEPLNFGTGTLANLASRATNYILESAFPNIFSQDRIFTLSTNNGGGDSIMGLGPTIVQRFVNTRSPNLKGDIYWDYNRQYASSENNGVGDGQGNTKNKDISSRNRQDVNDQSPNLNSSAVDGLFSELKNNDGNDLHSSMVDRNGLIDVYSTVAYGNIPSRTGLISGKINDFRKQIHDNNVNSQLTKDRLDRIMNDPKIADYENNSIHANGGIPDYGNINKKLDNLNGEAKRTNYKSKKQQITDRLTAFGVDGSKKLTTQIESYNKQLLYEEFFKTGEYKDLIDFYFIGLNKNKHDFMPFRAFISGLSDSHTPSWSSQQYIGRADPAYIYNSYERSISFTLKAFALSLSELEGMWQKINTLSSYTAPIYTGGIITAPLMRITIGDMFINMPGFIESFSLTVNDEMSWEIDRFLENNETDVKRAQMPKAVDISIGYKIIHDIRPQVGAPMYDVFNKFRFKVGDDKFNPLFQLQGSNLSELTSQENPNNSNTQQNGTTVNDIDSFV